MADWEAFFEDLAARAGETLTSSDWFVLDQRATDLYAALIGDLDPVHNDPAWAAGTGFGGTIAVGTHGLSMIPVYLARCGFPIGAADVAFAPVGLERVRFVAPLPVGHRAREHTLLRSAQRDGDRAWRVVTEHTIEREAEERPFMTAVFTARYALMEPRP